MSEALLWILIFLGFVAAKWPCFLLIALVLGGVGKLMTRRTIRCRVEPWYRTEYKPETGELIIKLPPPRGGRWD